MYVKTLAILALTTTAVVTLAPAADASGASVDCNDGMTRGYDDEGNVDYTSYRERCLLVVNDNGYIACVGATEEWYADDDSFSQGFSCDYGIKS